MTPAEVLAFWFGPSPAASRPEWFRKDPAFDAQIRARFGALWEAAAGGGLADWEQSPDGALALLVVLDQFSRNLHRGDARSFSQDARALALARQVVAKAWDHQRSPVERQFLYLPFEHAEDPATQDEAVALFTALEAFPETRGLVAWAEKHRAVIRRFGRFPHRNAALGRKSTAQELAYLAEPGSGF